MAGNSAAQVRVLRPAANKKAASAGGWETKMKKHVWYEDLDNVTCCPHCRRQIDVYYRVAFDSLEPYEPRFCPECGQNLDWTEALPYGIEEATEEAL